jgi:D-3-phosphoglycerate dehydrogenase
MNHKILIATRSFGSTSPRPWEVIEAAGCEWVKADMSFEMSEDRLKDLLVGVNGAIVGVVPLTASVLEGAHQLKVVSMHGVGVDHIDLQAAQRLGIVVANCLGSNHQAVADLTVGLMIAVSRNLPKVDQSVRRGTWGRHKGVELWQKTLGLIGLGLIGQGVAKRSLGFDMEVLVYDPYVSPENIGLQRLHFVNFEEVICEADYLSLHAPLNDETRHMISSADFERMKSSAFLINTARGGLVDEVALHNALTEGQIAGAALDVYQQEPPIKSPLLELPNVVLTPHIGAHTKEAIERMGVMAAENVVRVLAGEQPHNQVV